MRLLSSISPTANGSLWVACGFLSRKILVGSRSRSVCRNRLLAGGNRRRPPPRQLVIGWNLPAEKAEPVLVLSRGYDLRRPLGAFAGAYQLPHSCKTRSCRFRTRKRSVYRQYHGCSL